MCTIVIVKFFSDYFSGVFLPHLFLFLVTTSISPSPQAYAELHALPSLQELIALDVFTPTPMPVSIRGRAPIVVVQTLKLLQIPVCMPKGSCGVCVDLQVVVLW